MRWKRSAPTVSFCAVWPQSAECSKPALILQIDTSPSAPSGTTLGIRANHVNTWFCSMWHPTENISLLFPWFKPCPHLSGWTGFQTTVFFAQFWTISLLPSYVLVRTPSLFLRYHGGHSSSFPWQEYLIAVVYKQGHFLTYLNGNYT